MSFEEKFNLVKATGRKRLIEILKILIGECPRLEQGFASESHPLHSQSRLEVMYIVDVIEKELKALSFEEKKPSYQIWQEVFVPQNFTVKELDVLKKAMELFKQNTKKGIKKAPSKPTLRYRGKKV